jgi:cytochrome c oxidase cbb3-type subunit 3
VVRCAVEEKKMDLTRRMAIATCAVLLGLALAACEREERRLREIPPGVAASAVRVGQLQPGPAVQRFEARSPYEENAYAIAEGKRLFASFNCVGCHSHGGGGIGPPLMDDKWIYGSAPANIFATIVEGRPNGMPAFADKIPTPLVWQLVAYVRSLSGLVPTDAASGRSDHMQAKAPEMATEQESPTSTAAEHHQ